MQTMPSRQFGRLWTGAATRAGRRWVRLDPLAATLALGALLMLAAVRPSRPHAPPRRPTVPENPLVVAREIVILVNLEREQHGLAPLQVNARLVEDAKLHADQIASTGVFDHVILGGRYPTPRARAYAAGYRWDALGENLALGYPDATSAVDAWMKSPGHRANILAADYTETGVVLAPDAGGNMIVVQTFGAPDDGGLRRQGSMR